MAFAFLYYLIGYIYLTWLQEKVNTDDQSGGNAYLPTVAQDNSLFTKEKRLSICF